MKEEQPPRELRSAFLSPAGISVVCFPFIAPRLVSTKPGQGHIFDV